jgi:hypothetical protein
VARRLVLGRCPDGVTGHDSDRASAYRFALCVIS